MNLADIQGLVFHAYRRLPFAGYVLLRFQRDHQQATQRWLAELVDSQSIDSATPKDAGPDDRPGVRLNLAFTHTGLAALGLNPDALQTFPMVFADGLGAVWKNGQPDHRSRALGDQGDSAPHKWKWGYQGREREDEHGQIQRNEIVDALLLVFATAPHQLIVEIDRWIDRAVQCGAVAPDSSTILYGDFPADISAPVTEPFGFADGISQPVLKGAVGMLGQKGKPTQPEVHHLDDGELLLGHHDGARQVSVSPTIAAAFDKNRVLPVAHDDPARHDLGYNGTYLVFRQLAQNTDGFADACAKASLDSGLSESRFRALLVGRWQEGSPVIKCPIAHDPDQASAPAANDFGYRDDPHGERCPVGAHIRRANPRDSLGDDADESWRVSNRHRILRRGRPYRSGREQGLHFICLNADIERQFEFIQQNWINEGTFGGLDGEDDPMVGPRLGHAAVGYLTLPPPADTRVHRRVAGLARFVTVKGGGYFFLPSLTALRYLAHLPAASREPRAWSAAPPRLSKWEWVRFFFLARFPILLGAVLAAGPLMLVGGQLGTIARPMFLLGDPLAMAIVSGSASLTAAVAMMAMRIVQLHGGARFGVPMPAARALTWRRVLAWQALSVPAVAAAFWLSARDAVVGSVTLAAPELMSTFFRFGMAAVGGYLTAFFLFFVAAALRNTGVEPDNPEDSILLPASRLLAKFKRRQLPIFTLANPLVRFVESSIAALPPGQGAGYVDHIKRKILPGHLAAAGLAMAVGIVYVSGWWVFRPQLRVSFQPAPLAYLLFMLTLLGWAATGAAFFLDRFRVPLLTAFLAWVVLWVPSGTDHEFTVAGTALSGPPSIRSLIASADTYDAQRGGLNSTERPIIVVAAGGGGAHQAAWAARVLTGLTQLWGPAFSGNVRLISGVSAGSVGAMHYISRFTADGPPNGNLQSVVEAAKAPATSDIWWGISYPDLTRTLLPFSIKAWLPGTLDRGWALDQAWARALNQHSESSRPTVAEWQDGVARGWRPAVAFNAMVVETGARVVLATYALPQKMPPTIDVSWLTEERDLSIVTAARLSASFPLVTPAARASNSVGQKMIHLTDGGYWDNHAFVTVLEWLLAAETELKGRRVLVVRIPPPSEAGGRIGERKWPWQTVAPLQASLSMRTNAQRARNDLELDLFKGRNPTIEWVDFPYTADDTLLSWNLSRKERCDIEKEWETKYAKGRTGFEKIIPVLGTPGAWTPPVLQECTP